MANGDIESDSKERRDNEKERREERKRRESATCF
jgi:hypothetical protein